ncbi:MAG TPA: hypothetical protein VJZ51_04165 [Bacilli bacterium]|nr:hypothetical protein [Bacilli bacterium]
MNVNAASQEQLEEIFGWGAETWVANPLLQEVDFRTALYYAIDRLDITKTVAKTRNPELIYMNSAYVVMDGISGNIYRDTEAGKSVINGIYVNDLDLLEDSYGFSATLAKEFYVKALTNLVKAGTIGQGTEAEPVILGLELSLFDGDEQTKLGQYLQSAWETIFNGQTVYPNIQLDVTVINNPGMDVYYQKQMIGKFDIGIGGISGSALDPLGYMDVFFDTTDDSATENGLQLTWGVDTNNAEIEWNGMIWSFEALTQAANGPTFVVDGNNLEAAAYEAMVANGKEFLQAAAKAANKEDSEELKTALANVSGAVSIAAGFDAVTAGVTALFVGTALVGMDFAKNHFDLSADEYALECIALCQEDLDLIKSPGYESYAYAIEGLEAAVNTDILADAAAFKAGTYTTFQEYIEAFAAAKTQMYSYYLW